MRKLHSGPFNLLAERRLEILAPDNTGSNHWVRSYPILAASGGPGPKLQEGDGQIPEGIYPIELLNPNSLYHVSLRVGYPNALDRTMAARDGPSSVSSGSSLSS